VSSCAVIKWTQRVLKGLWIDNFNDILMPSCKNNHLTKIKVSIVKWALKHELVAHGWTIKF